MMPKNMIEPDMPQVTVRRMRFACWMIKATDTHSEYVILIGFPRQQWLRERVSMLRCTYTACLLCDAWRGISRTLVAQMFLPPTSRIVFKESLTSHIFTTHLFPSVALHLTVSLLMLTNFCTRLG